MMDLSFLSEYLQPMVVAGCLATGYVLKKWIEDVENKYIPTIVCIEGAILSCVINGGVSVDSIVAGAICGLASTGLHQMFTRLIEGKTGDS